MTASDERPRRDHRKLRTRRALIVAARGLLRDRRAAHLTIAEVTEAADVGVGTFYNHFSNLEALVDAAANDAFAELEMRSQGAVLEGDDPPLILAQGLLLALVDLEPNLIWWGFRSSLEEAPRPAVFDSVTQLLDWGYRDGHFLLRPDLALYLLSGALNGTAIATGQGHVGLDDHPAVVESILRQLGCEPARAADVIDVAARRVSDASARPPGR